MSLAGAVLSSSHAAYSPGILDRVQPVNLDSRRTRAKIKNGAGNVNPPLNMGHFCDVREGFRSPFSQERGIRVPVRISGSPRGQCHEDAGDSGISLSTEQQQGRLMI